MNIGIDATCWQNSRGYGRHARSLLSALVRLDTRNHYTFFIDSIDNLHGYPIEAELCLVKVNTATALAAAAYGHRSVRDLWSMSRALSKTGFDLLLFPTIYSYVPVFSKAKKILFIHDVIPEKYPEFTLPNHNQRWLWQTKVALGRWQADAIVTVSDYSRQEIVKYFNLSSDRIYVVGEASDPSFRLLGNPQITKLLISLGIPTSGRLISYVGGFGPHKNLELLVTAFANLSLKSEFPDTYLVMVGEYEQEVFYSQFGTLMKMIEELGITDRVIFTGFIPDEELVVLLNLSTVLALPSLMEGFGLPAIEAAACGCPVIATTASPLPSILGDGGLYIDPTKPEELENTLVRVLKSQDLQKQMRAAGLVAAHSLTWEKAAQEMINVIQCVVTI